MEWQFTSPLMNSFNKIEGAIFSMHVMLPWNFPFLEQKLDTFVCTSSATCL